MSTPSGCFCLPKIHLLTKFGRNCTRTKVILVYAAIVQQICSNSTAYSTFSGFHAWEPLFYPNYTSWPSFILIWKEIKDLSCMQQLCSKNAANMQQKIFFSTSTPSGCFCHAKIPLIPNFHAFFKKITLNSDCLTNSPEYETRRRSSDISKDSRWRKGRNCSSRGA